MLCITDFIQISIILVKFEKGSQAYILDTFYQNERKVFLDEKCMENVQDIRKNICIRVAVEIFTRFWHFLPYVYQREESQIAHEYIQNFYNFAEQNFTEIAPSLHFVMFKRQLRCNSCSYILITFNKIIFFCMQFKWYKPTTFCLLP